MIAPSAPSPPRQTTGASSLLSRALSASHLEPYASSRHSRRYSFGEAPTLPSTRGVVTIGATAAAAAAEEKAAADEEEEGDVHVLEDVCQQLQVKLEVVQKRLDEVLKENFYLRRRNKTLLEQSEQLLVHVEALVAAMRA
jgi:hypothetical protein